MAVTAASIKELREITGVGMSDCKKALVETDGDIDKAIEYLREKGLAAAAKKADRSATEGLVKVAILDDGKTGVVVEVNSETDFVAKNQAFVDYVDDVLTHIAKSNASDVPALLQDKWLHDGSLTVAEALSSKIAVIGENLNIRRFEKITKEDNTCFVDYIHGGGKVAVLLQLNCPISNEQIVEAGKNICMQIAAMSPRFVDRSGISQEFIDKETEILTQQALNEGKPANIVENMVKGRLNKQLKEFCLVDQEYVKGDDKESVKDYLDKVAKENNTTISVKTFVRFETGEGLEKKQENFAEEVSKAMGN